MTILYVIAHRIDPNQLSSNASKIKRALKILFSNGKLYVYLDEPRPWDNSYFNVHRMREQLKLMKSLLGDLCDEECLSVHKFVGKKAESSFTTEQEVEDSDDDM